MKKFTIFISLILLFSLFDGNSIYAQNLALNGGFESWTVNGAAGPADDWSLSSTSSTGAQETTNVRTGSYATNLTWTTTSTIRFEQTVAITAGNNYNFSFWALDNDPAGRVRVAVRWYDSGGSFISGYYGDYSSDNSSWQQLSSGSQTAPASAVDAHIEIRGYDVSSGWSGSATVYLDDAEFVQITSLEISKAYAISETAVDVVYSASVSSVSATDYSLTGTASITFSGASIDGSDNTLVHLTGASVNMVGDITVDNLADAANADNYDFYAGIMPIYYTNTTNPTGTMNNSELATFSGIISANDEYNNVWISDASGAYNGVLIYSSSFDALVDVGDEILMTADRTTYNNLSELENPELISTITTGNTPYGPDVIPGSDIDQSISADTNPGEKWEGQLVKIENFTVDSYVDYDYTCSWSDGSTTYYFHVGDNVDYHLNNVTLNVGDTYSSITGVVDWAGSGPYYRINPRQQSDVVASSATARIVGSMQGWNTTDPDYVMSLNANGLYELTKTLSAGDWEYKVLEGDDWGQPNYPATNQHVILTGSEDVTWKANITAELVTHTLPVVAGNFMSVIGGNDWDPTELMGEMSDPDGDDIFTLELTIPAGSYEAKVTLNNNWDQSTGGNVAFTTDGVNPTTFTYDFPNNLTTISGPPPPSATVTFIVEDTINKNYDGFYLKGSWDTNGQYDPSWGGGVEHSQFYDDGTHGDAVAGDNIWTCQQDLVVDGGSNTWEWGVNDTEHFWIAGNWQFTVPDQNPQTQIWLVPDVEDLVINEIMYNSPGTDEEWIELYNNSDQAINLENWRVCDNDQAHPNIVIPAGYGIDAGAYFTISIASGGNFPFTPDFDGTGNFGLNNGGDAVRLWRADNLLVDVVDYDDGSPWPTQPDGNGPSLSLIDPSFDNALGESWDASLQDGGTPGAENFPPLPYTIVTSPNGGEVITQGDMFTITWEYDLWTGDIDILLTKEGNDPELIVSNISVGDLSYNWTVMATQQPGNDYKILIQPTDPLNPSDDSDDYFQINEAVYIPNLVITEIMYNPPESGGDSLEFIEIYNNDDIAVDMDGYSFTAGIGFTFPSVMLNPSEYLLVAIDSAAFNGTFGGTALQWTDGALSNGGESIELSDSYLNVVDSLTYDDNMPWDTLADGHGPSLTLCNPDADNSAAENWTASVNFAAVNADGDSIYATPGFECQVMFMPGFSADVTYISVGESVIFTDESIGEPTEWIWTFEGGTPDTYSGQTPPPIVYNEEGTWDVNLYISDGVNSGDLTYYDYIEVVNFSPPTNLQAEVGPEDDVQLTWNAPVSSSYSDDFESYEDFVLDFSPWTNIDVDGSTTYGMTNVAWPNAYDPQSFIIFNPSQTVPPIDDLVPHSGNKLAACFASVTPANDDWMISPMTNISASHSVTLWAKSYTDEYGLERFRVGVSTTGTDPSDFTIISSGDYIEVPADEWTEYTFDLSSYADQNVYVGIQCVSNDAFILLVDDFSIGASKSTFAFNNMTSGIGRHSKDISFTSEPTSTYVESISTNRNVAANLLGYNVYRDSDQINASLVEVTEYNDPEPTIGSHDYYVTAVYDGGESGPSNVVSVIVTSILENEDSKVNVYPNPTDGEFVIEFDSQVTADIQLIDITGKNVFSTTLIQSEQINIKDLQKGLYFVRILDITNDNLTIKKLVVK